MSNYPDWKPAPRTTYRDYLGVLAQNDYLILDTETTGLREGEIVELAIINWQGTTVFNQRMRPSLAIPPEATAIHGITDDMVKSYPTWKDWHDKVAEILAGRNVIVYNAVYDRRMMHQSDSAWGLPRREWRDICHWYCAMEGFAELRGIPSKYGDAYRWHSLWNAAVYTGVNVVTQHGALADCQTTFFLGKAILDAASKLGGEGLRASITQWGDWPGANPSPRAEGDL